MPMCVTCAWNTQRSRAHGMGHGCVCMHTQRQLPLYSTYHHQKVHLRTQAKGPQ